MVADKCNNDIYQYLLDCEKWVKLNKFPKSIDKICGVFEINDVFYVVSNKGILALNNFLSFLQINIMLGVHHAKLETTYYLFV